MARLTPGGLPRAEEKAAAVQSMFDRIAPRYDLINRILTGGLDARWRRRTVAALDLPPGSRVADLACGTGMLCQELLRAGHRPTGFDSSQGMLDRARTRAPLVRADILDLPLADGEMDGVTCGFALRNVTDLRACFAEMARVLRPGGRAALLEVAEPEHELLRRIHGVYFWRVVPAVGGILSDRSAYRYLPRSTAYLPPPRGLLDLLSAAGFVSLHREALGLGAAQLLTATRA